MDNAYPNLNERIENIKRGIDDLLKDREHYGGCRIRFQFNKFVISMVNTAVKNTQYVYMDDIRVESSHSDTDICTICAEEFIKQDNQKDLDYFNEFISQCMKYGFD